MPTKVAIIPARGGSTRFKDKNIAVLGGTETGVFTAAQSEAGQAFTVADSDFYQLVSQSRTEFSGCVAPFYTKVGMTHS